MTRLKDLFSVLVLSARRELADDVAGCLDNGIFEPPRPCTDHADGRRRMLQHPCDMVIIDASLPKCDICELALDMSENHGAAVIVIAGTEVYDQIRYRLERDGILTLAKPYTADSLESGISLSLAAHRRVLAMEEENRRLSFKLEELRLVNRAKWALHENLGMDEPAAHRYIEKNAMNNRTTRYAVAQKILKEYE